MTRNRLNRPEHAAEKPADEACGGAEESTRHTAASATSAHRSATGVAEADAREAVGAETPETDARGAAGAGTHGTHPAARPATGSDVLLSLRGVSFSYAGGREGTGVRDVTLDVRAGEVALLCGRSGCGKTTVTRIANGLAPHFYEGELAGSVRVGGLDPSRAPLWQTARSVGSVFQNPKTQFYNVDVAGEVAFCCENLGLPPREVERRRDGAVHAFDLDALLGRSLFALSGGQKQRVACASSTAHDPALVVLDEPSSNLDFAAIAQLRHAIERWKREGKAILVAEHRIHYLAGLADSVHYMEGGRIARSWTGEEFARVSREELAHLGLRCRRLADVFRPHAPAVSPTGDAEAHASREPAAAEEAGGRDVPAGGIAPYGIAEPALGGATPGTGAGVGMRVEELGAFYRADGRWQQALDVPALDLPPGSVTALVGANGAGKSTFAEALVGLNRCSGALVTCGRELGKKERQRTCFMVMQDVNHQLFAESVLDEVLLGTRGMDEKGARELLARLDLERFADEHPLSLSGGERQRVALACALASDRSLVVYDEPTSGLDLAHMRQVAETVRSMRDSAVQVVITHDSELILACCTRVAVMDAGHIANVYDVSERTLPRLQAFFERAFEG